MLGLAACGGAKTAGPAAAPPAAWSAAWTSASAGAVRWQQPIGWELHKQRPGGIELALDAPQEFDTLVWQVVEPDALERTLKRDMPYVVGEDGAPRPDDTTRHGDIVCYADDSMGMGTCARPVAGGLLLGELSASARWQALGGVDALVAGLGAVDGLTAPPPLPSTWKHFVGADGWTWPAPADDSWIVHETSKNHLDISRGPGGGDNQNDFVTAGVSDRGSVFAMMADPTPETLDQDGWECRLGAEGKDYVAACQQDAGSACLRFILVYAHGSRAPIDALGGLPGLAIAAQHVEDGCGAGW